MSDLPAAEAEAAEATRPPRFSFVQGLLAAAVGSAAISCVLILVAIFAWTEGPLWVTLLAALAYSLALLVWAGLWKRPLQAAAIIAAALAGLFAGYLVGAFVATVATPGPDL